MIQQMIVVEMEMPKNKLPGFYGQIVHKIGDQVKLFDRYLILFVVEDHTQAAKLHQIFDKYQVNWEDYRAWVLPPDTNIPLIDRFGFTGILGNKFLFTHQVTPFQLQGDADNSHLTVTKQLQDHIIAQVPSPTGTIYFIDSIYLDVAIQLAQRYQVGIAVIDGTSQ